MKKQALIIEIEDLLISINNHFVDVENNIRIPNIELDVISSKISKLHEKIAVFKFLNEQDEFLKPNKMDVGNQKLTKIETLKTLSFDVSPVINLQQNYNDASNVDEKKQHAVVLDNNTIEKKEEIVNVENSSSLFSSSSAESSIKQSANLTDIKKLMSINDRLLFQNELFGNVALDFNSFTDKINASINFTDANFYFDTIAKQRNWKKEDETVFTLKRYIHKRFND